MSVRILIGDVREKLAELPPDHFDCVVTSPPYWGLRDYGVEGQAGLERTLGEHLSVMVEIMRQVRRVLKPTGSLWLNYGDCYATSPNGRSAADTKAAGNDDRTFRDKPFSTVGPIYETQPESRQAARRGRSGNLANGGINGLSIPAGRVVAGGTMKPKDLCMVPNRLAIALQNDGWWVRSEIIWAKPNPMPESIRDRPATAHEKIFLLTKSARYFWNGEAVRQRVAETSGPRLLQDIDAQAGSARDNFRCDGSKRAGASPGQVAGTHRPDRPDSDYPLDGRNLRNYEPAPVEVWPMATKPFREAHFATFPPELVERCLGAGCPPGGTVLDPFGGAGTTGLVADRAGLDCTLIELNPAYVEIAERRLTGDAGMFADVAAA